MISRQEVGSGAFLFTYAKFFWSHLFKKSLKTSKTSPILNGCRTLAVSVVLEINVYLMKNLFLLQKSSYLWRHWIFKVKSWRKLFARLDKLEVFVQLFVIMNETLSTLGHRYVRQSRQYDRQNHQYGRHNHHKSTICSTNSSVGFRQKHKHVHKTRDKNHR